jgi:endogenous inhibitor of DNA gyrase (YacG/DUF329 family)
MPMSRQSIRNGAKKGCPICGQPSASAFHPFCGQGCRDRDLLQWLGEGYRVAGTPADVDGREIDADGLDSEP